MLPACGVLQVSNPERLIKGRRLSFLARDRLRGVTRAYLGKADASHGLGLADPLVVLERGEKPARPLPAFFAGVGGRDPLVPDTVRLGRALARVGVPHKVKIYPGQGHAFEALPWKRQSREFWRDTFSFLDRVLR